MTPGVHGMGAAFSSSVEIPMFGNIGVHFRVLLQTSEEK